MAEIPMSEHSEYVKEMAKHEQFPSKWTPGDLKPGNPPERRASLVYPKMLYKPQRLPNGKWAVSCPIPPRRLYPTDDEWNRAIEDAERFTAGCQRVVKDEEEHEKARHDGWMDHPKEALEHQEGLDRDVSTAAAERAYADRNMSAAAKAEVEAKEAEHFGHLGEIPEEPLPPRRRAVARRKKATRRKKARRVA